jgi:uncharacterized protein YlxW (UPF0749 family)
MISLALAFWMQSIGDAGVSLNVTPMFVVAAITLSVVIVVHIVKISQFTTELKQQQIQTRRDVDDHGEEIKSLRADRHDAKERLAVLEAHAEATAMEFERQRQEERDIRTAMSELIQQQRRTA